MKNSKKLFSALSSIIILVGILSPLSYSYGIYDSSIYLTQDIPKSINRIDNLTLVEMIQQVNESTLENHIQTIQDFGPHPTGSIELEEVKDYLYQQLNEYDLSVDLKPWKYKFKSGYNVEATLPCIGSSNGIVIICAHYDSVAVSPGADDDGSGVASVLTIAEIMSETECNSTIKFVLFSGEEQGLYGSHKYAEEAYENQENIIGVICLDGVGYADNYLSGHTIKNFADESSDWIVDISRSIIEEYNEYVNLEILRFPNERISDHHSFYELGFQTSYFLEYTINPYYHTSEDTIDKMNMSYLTKICRLALGTVAGMAEVNRVLRNEDIEISMKGSILSYPAQLIVRVENKRYSDDTANLTIHIEMKNLFTGEYVEGPYNSSSNWIFQKEINDYWEFVLASHIYSFELMNLEVTIKGFNDDIGLYKERHAFGVVGKSLILLVPKF
jgi:hypothetical protein